MLPDQVSNPGPLTYESGVLPIALRGPGWLELSYAGNYFHGPKRVQATEFLLYFLFLFQPFYL